MLFFVTERKKISLIFIIIIFSLAILCSVLFLAKKSISEELPLNGINYIYRTEFIKSLGYKVNINEDEKQKEIEIPYIFSDVYENYNRLQLSVGYNLEDYCGKTVTLYTLHLNYPERDDVYANLLVYKGSIIGGDITAVSAEDGFMLPLALISEK